VKKVDRQQEVDETQVIWVYENLGSSSYFDNLWDGVSCFGDCEGRCAVRYAIFFLASHYRVQMILIHLGGQSQRERKTTGKGGTLAIKR